MIFDLVPFGKKTSKPCGTLLSRRYRISDDARFTRIIFGRRFETDLSGSGYDKITTRANAPHPIPSCLLKDIRCTQIIINRHFYGVYQNLVNFHNLPGVSYYVMEKIFLRWLKIVIKYLCIQIDYYFL